MQSMPPVPELGAGDPSPELSRQHAKAIWQAGVEAVQPARCMADFFQTQLTALPGLKPEAQVKGGVNNPSLALQASIQEYDRILVVGGGKAGAAMAQALENELEQLGISLGRVSGLVNVPTETVMPLKAIQLHPARPIGTNQPTEAAVKGTRAILRIAEEAGANDFMICLISGGGSALLPAPVPGVSLADKQQVTRLLDASGATIHEMNAVRKHLSQIKGGNLARRFRGRQILSLIISDVIGDSLDVIASGPTCTDPATFADALSILDKYELTSRVPASVLAYLRRGADGKEPETLKKLPVDADNRPIVHNVIIAGNEMALAAAALQANELGYAVHNLGSRIQGETAVAAAAQAEITLTLPSPTVGGGQGGRSRPACILSGGETTVTLSESHGLGGRNQEFVLAFLHKLGTEGMREITVLSGGTDGEDGPTDAAGAVADAQLLVEAKQQGLNPGDYLARHDAYHFFKPLGGLLMTGLTHTNVMDLRVILVSS